MEGSRGSQILLWVLGALLLLCIGVTLVWRYLPAYAERRLIPSLVENLTQDRGWGPVSVQVRRLSLGGVDLSDLVLGDPRDPAITADSLRADFDLGDLIHKRIARLTLGGVRIGLRLTRQGVELPGLPLSGPASADPRKATSPGELLPLDELRITQSRIEVQWNGQILRVPLELSVRTDPGDPTQLSGRLRLLPWGRQLVLNGRLQGDPARLVLQFESEPLPLDQLSALLPREADVQFHGELSLKGSLALNLADLALASAQVQLGLHRPLAKVDATLIRLSPSAHSRGPLRIEIHRPEGGHWRVEGPPVRVTAPLPLELSRWQVIQTGTPEPRGWELTATLTPNWHQMVQPWGMELPENRPLALDLAARYHFDGNWQAKVVASSAPQLPLSFPKRELILHVESPILAVSAQGRGAQAAGEYQIQLAGCRLNSPDLQFRSGSATLSGQMAWRPSDPQGPLKTRYRFATMQPQGSAGGLTARFPQIEITGEAEVNPNGNLRTRGSLAFADAALHDPARRIEFDSVSGVLPYRWPLEKEMPPGELTVGRGAYQQFNLGSTMIQFQPDPKGVDVKGSIRGALLPQMSGTVSGRLAPLPPKALGADIALDLDLPMGQAENLGQWLPAARGHQFQGAIRAKLNLRLEGGRPTLETDLRVEAGTLENPDTQFKVQGIELKMAFPDLFSLRSAPAQVATFDALTLGRLQLDSGEIVFQIEAGPGLFVEESRVQWCDGRVFTGPVRIGGDPDLGVDLFCDRLGMAPLLAQIANFDAQGRGTLNGRIPVRWQRGQLRFEDGFLYSSPGEEGHIRLAGTEILTAALPPGSPQANQVEVAREALKDYTYNWAKLELNSEGEALRVHMKLDGQPAANLPFVFDPDLGGFRRVGPDHEGSKFQGIRLDVNFNLPLNSLLGQYETFQQILNPQ